MTVHREANLSEQMLAPIVSEGRKIRDQARGRGKERLLEGCASVRQFDVIADEDDLDATARALLAKGTMVPS